MADEVDRRGGDEPEDIAFGPVDEPCGRDEAAEVVTRVVDAERDLGDVEEARVERVADAELQEAVEREVALPPEIDLAMPRERARATSPRRPR